MRKTAAILLTFLATVSFADQPSRDTVTQQLFVLRANLASNPPDPFEGIFTYDLDTKKFTPLTTLAYAESLSIEGAVRLGATADRIILQGSEYLEFDAASGRLLRRYEGSDAVTDKWAFQGAVVTEEQARILGIPSGTYGFPFCPFYPFTDPASPCIPHQFPGYPAPTLSPFSVLLRRSLDPADLSLSLVRVLPAGNSAAAIAFDPPHQQFWLWTENQGRRWATIPITNGTIGAPAPSTLAPAAGTVFSLAFHNPTRSLMELFTVTNLDERILQQRSTLDLSAAPEVISRDTLHNSVGPRIDSATAVSDTLPGRYVQVIPAIGETPGANGTFWHSDLWLYNPSNEGFDVSLRRVVKPQQIVTRFLPAHGSLALRDVLQILGGGPSGDGVTTDALVIDAPYHWGAQLAAYSRTYTAGSDGGTYGQSVPAVPSLVGYSNHVRDYTPPSTTTGFPSTIVLDKRDVSRFRHNVGVVNDTNAPFDVRLNDGFHKFSIPIAAHSVGNINLEALFPDSNGVLFAADRPTPVWLSMIDNISGDATFVPFTNLSTVGDDTTAELAIPAVGTTHGAGGTTWRTDLFGTFPTTFGSETLDHPFAHLDAATGCSADTHLTSDGPYIYRDVAHQFGACDPGGGVVGAMRMRGASWMQGFSRTYTSRADGGTLGDMLPFYPAHGWPLQHFSGLEVGSRFRINVGLYNGSSVTTTNRLFLYDATGALVAQRDVDLGSHASLQAPLASLMNVANLPAGIYGLSVIPNGDGRSWAYVSLVDNISGDPTNFW